MTNEDETKLMAPAFHRDAITWLNVTAHKGKYTQDSHILKIIHNLGPFENIVLSSGYFMC